LIDNLHVDVLICFAATAATRHGGHARNRVRRVAQSLMERGRKLMRKRHPDPKVQVGNVPELSKTLSHKAKPFEPGVSSPFAESPQRGAA
jgi:hypothetical protein